MNGRRGGWIQTFTGRRFYPLDPRPDEVALGDVAHALSMQCRFTGHVKQFYSVAQHSVLVSRHCDPADALWGLLHDAAEAYLADVARPVKGCAEFLAYRRAECLVMDAVCRAFGLDPAQPASVYRADVLLLATEARDLMAPLCPGWEHVPENGYAVLPERIEPASPGVAEEMFLSRYLELKR